MAALYSLGKPCPKCGKDQWRLGRFVRAGLLMTVDFTCFNDGTTHTIHERENA